jgi:hypothetical protein
MRRAALGETAAHLDYLTGRDQVTRSPGHPDTPDTYEGQPTAVPARPASP